MLPHPMMPPIKTLLEPERISVVVQVPQVPEHIADCRHLVTRQRNDAPISDGAEFDCSTSESARVVPQDCSCSLKTRLDPGARANYSSKRGSTPPELGVTGHVAATTRRQRTQKCRNVVDNAANRSLIEPFRISDKMRFRPATIVLDAQRFRAGISQKISARTMVSR
jgi:hypothetical protein